MGYNTTILVLNDAVSHIQNHPADFADGIYEAIIGGSKRITAGGMTAAEMICCDHANTIHVVAVGGNTGFVVTSLPDRPKDIETEALKSLAKKLGYRLTKIKERKMKNGEV